MAQVFIVSSHHGGDEQTIEAVFGSRVAAETFVGDKPPGDYVIDVFEVGPEPEIEHEAERTAFISEWRAFVSAGYNLLARWSDNGFDADEVFGPMNDSRGNYLFTMSFDDWLSEMQWKAERFT